MKMYYELILTVRVPILNQNMRDSEIQRKKKHRRRMWGPKLIASIEGNKLWRWTATLKKGSAERLYKSLDTKSTWFHIFVKEVMMKNEHVNAL
jgi:hypothetical protein